MYRVAILGCENSHANNFLDIVRKHKCAYDLEFVGVYSDDIEAANKLSKEFGVPVAQSYDEFVGKIDGLIITARNGDNHFKYAKPYIESGIPMFIDKPITNSEDEAVEFMRQLKKNNVRICGGSSCIHVKAVKKLAENVKNNKYGKVLGGHLRAPINLDNPYGGFFFYAQHLVQVMCEIFGNYPKSVQTFKNPSSVVVIIRYDEFDVTAEYVDGNYLYYVAASCETEYAGSTFVVDGCFVDEFNLFYTLLGGKEQVQSYKDFIAPVFIMNAIYRSLNSGKEEVVASVGEI